MEYTGIVNIVTSLTCFLYSLSLLWRCIMKRMSLSINVDVLYDELSNKLTIDRINGIATLPNQSTIRTMQRKLQVTEKRYGILLLGSKSEIGQVIPRDDSIKVLYNGSTYSGHSHKSTTGRIDALSDLITNNFHVNDVLDLEYDTNSKELTIKNVTHEN